jgi:hypothetical protein
MTPKQLRAALARLGLSQRAAARLLDINERTMRKYIAGDLVIPELTRNHCGLMLAARITFAHISISATMRVANSFGVLATRS